LANLQPGLRPLVGRSLEEPGGHPGGQTTNLSHTPLFQGAKNLRPLGIAGRTQREIGDHAIPMLIHRDQTSGRQAL
jgi:hypothetical protein